MNRQDGLSITLSKPQNLAPPFFLLRGDLQFLLAGAMFAHEEDGRIVAVEFSMEESPGSTGRAAR